MKKPIPTISEQEWETCISVLHKLKDYPELAHDELVLKGLVVKMYKNARKRNKQKAKLEAEQLAIKKLYDGKPFHEIRKEQKKEAKDLLKEHDQQAKESTYIFQRNDERVQEMPDALLLTEQKEKRKLFSPVHCYVCKQSFKELHFFYHLLCPQCAAFNFEKRTQSTNLENRVALLTGGRIKIGFELALKMLRDGATVIITTRFPNDAKRRYEQISDYHIWKNRLYVFGLDLRNIPQVESFIATLYQRFDYLDIIINNAAQTIKRPLAFYQHLLEGEQKTYLLQAKEQEVALYEQYFPANQYDKDEQQIDLRPDNSWVAKLNEVETMEMLEVQLVNVTAPFLLNSRLKSLMVKSPFKKRFIINVSAMEGQFYRKHKTIFHPHTNMAKAALNMMTRTSAADYAQDAIFMNSVDTGWITNENPHPKKERMRDQQHFVTPIDSIDGAARVYDPIAVAINEPDTKPLFGLFLKDYKKVSW